MIRLAVGPGTMYVTAYKVWPGVNGAVTVIITIPPYSDADTWLMVFGVGTYSPLSHGLTITVDGDLRGYSCSARYYRGRPGEHVFACADWTDRAPDAASDRCECGTGVHVRGQGHSDWCRLYVTSAE